jgi:hypothetical protein
LIPRRNAYLEARVLAVAGNWVLATYPTGRPFVVRLDDLQLRGETPGVGRLADVLGEPDASDRGVMSRWNPATGRFEPEQP